MNPLVIQSETLRHLVPVEPELLEQVVGGTEGVTAACGDPDTVASQ